MASDNPFTRIGIMGAGSMGSMMSLSLAEKGYHISLLDVNTANVRSALEKAQQTGQTKDLIEGFEDIGAFAKSFGDQKKLVLFSISHGHPADSVLEMLQKESALKNGDVVLDGGNEYYRSTERRQRGLMDKGVSWIDMGVSGGYQSARRGPSSSPRGNEATVKLVILVLETFAAKAKTKDGKERPRVDYIGQGGARGFVKIVHNGIEAGHWE
jgi:6-phosphogluconate dehydrogenase